MLWSCIQQTQAIRRHLFHLARGRSAHCRKQFYAGQDGSGAGHMNSTEVGKIAKEANVGELIITHLPHFGRHKDLVNEAQALYTGSIQLAHSGLRWNKEGR